MLGEIGELGSLLYNYRRPLSELQALQDRRLRALIRHAYTNVPYYRALFESAGLTPRDIQTVQDLARIPITTKQTLRSLPIQDRVAAGTDLKTCLTRRTSGTTGEPFTVYFSPAEIRERQLVDFRALLAAGARPWDRVVILGPRARPRRWYERSGLFRTKVIPSTIALGAQIQRLREFQPTVLWAYAHDLDAILHELRGKLSSVVRPRVLVTSALSLPEPAARALRADLGIELFNFYGAMEAGRIAHECPAHRGLHINIDRLVLECIQGDSSAGTDGMGGAVVTVLDFFTMPFIRYRLGDWGAFSTERCLCGSAFPLMCAPQGREYELFVLPSGKRVAITWLNLLLRALDGVERYQVVQERPDYIEVLLSFSTRPSPEILDNLKRRIADGFQEPIQIEIRVTNIAWEQGRKFKMFVTKAQNAATDL